ncbi:LysM peptidoglycan-binding domain-containing protein [Pseudorhodoferax sp.]|uniref:LysM peptidoglycan-binding domain-containing protein n=1 Tax=Pseudorhodoferax sp. TaxID=1993553 RepID=UPI002DD69F38|nr:LysM domain-containing protein [Pseudorhodoferax sp.]
MARTPRLRRLALLTGAVALAGWQAACTTPPAATPASSPAPVSPPAVPAAEPPPPPPAVEPASTPATPASAQQAQRLAVSAIEMLELGHEDQATAELQRALQADASNRLAQSLLRQIQTDPQALLGRESFSYRVEPGESLSRIAGRFLKDVHLFYALARYNDIRVPRQVQGGQVIRIPGRPPVAAASPAPAASVPAPVAAPASPAAAPVPPPPAPAPSRPPVAEPPSAATVVAREYRRGLSLMAQQKPAEAVQAFDAVLDQEPGHANARLKRAQAMSQVSGLIRLLENSIRRLDVELARNPGNAAARAERDKAIADRERLLAVR